MPVDSIRKTNRQRNPSRSIASQIAALAGGRVRVILKRQRSWASITFSGTRYCFSIEWFDTTATDEIRHLSKVLPDHEFAIPGCFVADIVVTKQTEFQMQVEALSIIDPAKESPYW
ncbi:MAG: hypothetical protein KBT59_01670 [Sphingomonadales bacterium]|nr:hypothetical protein [Sphingomonadales bacterium]